MEIFLIHFPGEGGLSEACEPWQEDWTGGLAVECKGSREIFSERLGMKYRHFSGFGDLPFSHLHLTTKQHNDGELNINIKSRAHM